MKILLLLITLAPTLLFSQYTENCIPDNLYQISTASGMKIRKGPGTHNEVVAYVPSKDYVLVCDELSTPATFEGKNGNWRRVRYKNSYGYLFDGFVKKAKSNIVLNEETWLTAELPDVKQILDTAKTRTDTNKTVVAMQDTMPVVSDETPVDSLRPVKEIAVHSISVSETTIKDTLATAAVDIITPVKGDTYIAETQKDTMPIDAIGESVILETEIAPSTKAPAVNAEPIDYIFAVETFNYCGEITHLDPGVRWYGIYYDNDMKVYRNTRIELEVMRSKYALGTGLEFDIKSESSVSPHFMLGTKSKLDTNFEVAFTNSYFETRPRSLYPGQSVNIYSSEPIHDIYNFNLFATGNVTDVGICPVMENYKMKLTGEMNDSLVVQDLTVDIPFFGKCGMPSIYWFGDFNQDAYPDFILASQGKEQTTFVLFVSDTRTNGKLVRKAGEWSYKKCD